LGRTICAVAATFDARRCSAHVVLAGVPAGLLSIAVDTTSFERR
jgi:hypothetical protein